MTAIGHRQSLAGERKFTSNAAVEHYLTVPDGPGCGKHRDNDCLCDVRMDRAVEATCTPLAFVGVSTLEELELAAANVWLTLDVMRPPSSRSHATTSRPGAPPTPVPDQATCDKLMELIKDGLTHDEVMEALPGVSEDFYTCTRRLLGVYSRPKALTKEFPIDDVLHLVETTNMTVMQMIDWLYDKYGYRYHNSTIGKNYKLATGQSLAVRRNGHWGRVNSGAKDLFRREWPTGNYTYSSMARHIKATLGVNVDPKTVGEWAKKGLHEEAA